MKLRKVMFKKWIAREEIGEGAFKRQKEGTNCWEKDFTNAGLFHQWGCSYEEFESGAGNFTVAIVELPDGTIQQVLPINLKFVDLPSYYDCDHNPIEKGQWYECSKCGTIL